jgi:hypothetical protein
MSVPATVASTEARSHHGELFVAELDGPELDGPELDGPELDGPELDGADVHGASAAGFPRSRGCAGWNTPAPCWLAVDLITVDPIRGRAATS